MISPVFSDHLKDFLDSKYNQYNNPGFINSDPVSIPHLFTKKEDIEIMGFWASMLAWGQRVTIINKSKQLIELMDGTPHDFIMNHSEHDLKPFLKFRHRTFNDLDTLYFMSFFRHFYEKHKSLEEAFLYPEMDKSEDVGKAISLFHKTFFALEHAPGRTRKHVSTPEKNSACKRINMFLRWMVRKDNNGVDFGIWNNIKPSQLICPCDLHVDRVARSLGLIKRPKTDWLTAVELTNNLKTFDPTDPVKYDFALFGIGIEEKGIVNYKLPPALF